MQCNIMLATTLSEGTPCMLPDRAEPVDICRFDTGGHP